MTEFERLRIGMVDGQIRTADVTDHRVLAAFLSTPRESFVPPARRGLAYLDVRTPLGPQGRLTLDPMTLAKLVQLADVRAGERALVVGAGLGYTAAILAGLGARVVALEEDSGLAAGAREALSGLAGVTVVEGALTDGAPSEGPFDLIFLDGSVEDGLEALAAQLAPGGRIVGVAGDGKATKATVFRAGGQGLSAQRAFDAHAPALPGFARAESFAF